MMVSHDARELQPKEKTIDLTRQGTGQAFYAVIETSTYHSIDPAVVYPKVLTVVFMAKDFRHAVNFAEAMSVIIQLGHDVWQTTVREVGEAKLGHLTVPERPVAAS